MASTFEAKHPRAKDGKFAEKRRAESGLELSCTPDDQKSIRDVEDLERGEIFVGKVKSYHPGLVIGDVTKYEHERCEKIAPGLWWLSQKREMENGTTELTYCHNGGFVTETFDENGYITQQVFMDDEFNRIQDAGKWTEKDWNKDGVLIGREKEFFPEDRDDESYEIVSKAVDKAGGSLVASEDFSDSGIIEKRLVWSKSGGELYQTKEIYDKNGNPKYRFVRNFYGEECPPENTPTYEEYRNGKVCAGAYKTNRGGKIVYHRTDGPALFGGYDSVSEIYRYFLDGKEYTKAEWAKRTGNE